MNIEDFRTYCLNKKGVTEEIPFPKATDVLVYKVMNKMFAVTDIITFDSITLKCKPETIEELRAHHPAVNEPAYFSKKHWSNIKIDDSIPDKLLFDWIDISYNLVVAKLTKKLQAELNSLK